MPPSALDQLTRLNVDYPMLFQLTNSKKNRVSHAGVLEFVADEGKVYIPFWVSNMLHMQDLYHKSNAFVSFRWCTICCLKKATLYSWKVSHFRWPHSRNSSPKIQTFLTLPIRKRCWRMRCGTLPVWRAATWSPSSIIQRSMNCAFWKRNPEMPSALSSVIWM